MTTTKRKANPAEVLAMISRFHKEMRVGDAWSFEEILEYVEDRYGWLIDAENATEAIWNAISGKEVDGIRLVNAHDGKRAYRGE